MACEKDYTKAELVDMAVEKGMKVTEAKKLKKTDLCSFINKGKGKKSPKKEVKPKKSPKKTKASSKKSEEEIELDEDIASGYALEITCHTLKGFERLFNIPAAFRGEEEGTYTYLKDTILEN